jgi:hypothetical protein
MNGLRISVGGEKFVYDISRTGAQHIDLTDTNICCEGTYSSIL